jgi:hypothetical protein
MKWRYFPASYVEKIKIFGKSPEKIPQKLPQNCPQLTCPNNLPIEFGGQCRAGQLYCPLPTAHCPKTAQWAGQVPTPAKSKKNNF